MSIRLKTIITFSIASIFGTSFLWTFNIFYVLRNWGLFWDGLVVFASIVAGLIIVSDIIIWFTFRASKTIERRISDGEELDDGDNAALDGLLWKMPVIIFATNSVGYFIGPLLKRIMSAIVQGGNPWNLSTITTVVYSVSIGVYIAFIEIRLIERFLQPLLIARGRISIEGMKRRSWSKRQHTLVVTILLLVFGLFFSAGQGYLLEELFAPIRLSYENTGTDAVTTASGQVTEVAADEVSAASDAAEQAGEDDYPGEEVDSVSAASRTNSDRIELWERALNGEVLSINENDPEIRGRLAEYTIKMLLLGLIAAALSLTAARVEAGTTRRRLVEMNERLRAIGEGSADSDRKLVIIRADALGMTAHWVNVFIDRQASVMAAIRNSIDSLDSSSEKLEELNITAEELGKGIENGILRVKSNIDNQHRALTDVESSIGELGETIRKTNENVQKQNEAMGTNTVSMEQMAASIGSVSRNSQGAYENTQILIGNAEQSGSEMKTLREGIAEIAASAGEVTKAVVQINKISAQTNLLAMNAAIEAAHAGDVGAGFAVVASEVRKLAEYSSVVTGSISELIGRMNQLSTGGLQQANDARDSFNDIQDRVKNNSVMIAEISNSMKEQESGSIEMRNAMKMLKELTDDVAAITEIQQERRTDVAGGMDRLTGAANDIQQSMDGILEMISRFDSFISTLGTMIEENARLIADLKTASGSSDS